jgi:hypothetical protein
MAALVLAGLCASAGGVFFGLYESQRRALLSEQQQRQLEFTQHFLTGQQAAADGRLALERKNDKQAEEALDKAATALARASTQVPVPDPDDLRGQIDKLVNQVRADRAELKRRQEMQPRIDGLRDDWRKVLFHEISLSKHDRPTNLAQVCRLAPQALARFDVDTNRAAEESVAALKREQQRFASPDKLREVVEMCGEVLLAWGDAEAQTGLSADKQPAQRIAAAQRALQLLDIAAALAAAHGLTDSAAYHRRRASYLAQASRDNEVAAEQRQADRLTPSTARDYFLAGLEHFRQGNPIWLPRRAAAL